MVNHHFNVPLDYSNSFINCSIVLFISLHFENNGDYRYSKVEMIIKKKLFFTDDRARAKSIVLNQVFFFASKSGLDK